MFIAINNQHWFWGRYRKQDCVDEVHITEFLQRNVLYWNFPNILTLYLFNINLCFFITKNPQNYNTFNDILGWLNNILIWIYSSPLAAAQHTGHHLQVHLANRYPLRSRKPQRVFLKQTSCRDSLANIGSAWPFKGRRPQAVRMRQR